MALTNTFLIEADIKRKNHIGKPVVTANDSITFIISVMDNGVPMDLANVTSANLVSWCPDRQVVETVGVIGQDGKVTFSLSTEETAVAGTVRATVQLHGADGRVSTISFTYEVAKDLLTLHTPSVRERTLIEVVLEDGPLRIQEAEAATLDANLAAAKAEQVATDNKTRFLSPVDTVALRNSTYPNPVHGDTVRVTSEASVYRFQTGSGWVKTDQYDPTAIGNVAASLAEKATKAEVQAVASGSPKGTFSTLAALTSAHPNGNTNIYIVTADGKWYYWQNTAWTAGGVYQSTGVAAGSLKPNAVSGITIFKDKSPNLFDLSKIVTGGYFEQMNGSWVVSSGYVSSGLIPVEEGKVYTNTSSSLGRSFYRENGTYVAKATFPVPSGQGIFYMRTTAPINSTALSNEMVVEGNTLPSSYVAFDDKVIYQFDSNTINVKNIEPSSVSHVDKIPASINLFDISKVEYGGYYQSSTGNWVVLKTNYSSDLMPVKPNINYARNTTSGQVTYWDSTGAFVSGADIGVNTTFKVPNNPNIKYVRIAGNNNKMANQIMVVEGITLPATYVPYNSFKYKFDESMFDFGNVERVESKSYLTPEVKEYRRVVNPIITKSIVTDRTEMTGVADPFIVFDKGCYHMFFEVVQGRSPNTLLINDEVAHAYSYDLKNWTYTKVVISVEEHGRRAAYPNVFKYEGEWYMIPDTGASVNLFKATNFPLEWEFDTELMSGAFADTNIFKIGDVWFLTTSIMQPHNISLYYNQSGDWRNNQWVKHPIGEIILQDATEKGKRNAGNIFRGDDYIIMPIQHTPLSTNIYGEYTDWYKLSNITTTTCTVTRLGRAVDATHTGDWRDDAMHHISHVKHDNGIIYAVDGFRNGEYTIGLYEND